jgi:hypothetical protein
VVDAEPTRVRRVEVQEIEPDPGETDAAREPGEASREIVGTESTTESVESSTRPAPVD